MIILAFCNIFLGIAAIVMLSKGWEKFDSWVYRRFSAAFNQMTLFLFMSLFLFILFTVITVLIGTLNHFSLINTFFVASFILLCVNFFSPYYSSHMVNEERVFMKYAVKIPSDTSVTVFDLKMTPFLIASLGIVAVSAVVTIAMI
ncbi:hypothetical protein [[Bacillus] enclensis]|uniref:hypothetical protein n=1 Tax=[Bacillus] enclensis TaxID=1402860 RepID=UPI0018DE7F8E|nr:hypothetical protein [[Bacillus] enclensis]MBH9964896.1 hypothetical protein [[Bacillus] enclensis]